MNSLDQQARSELVDKLRQIYIGSGMSGGGGKGSGRRKGSKNKPSSRPKKALSQGLSTYQACLAEIRTQSPRMPYREAQKRASELYKLGGCDMFKPTSSRTIGPTITPERLIYQKAFRGSRKPPPPFEDCPKGWTLARKCRKRKVYKPRKPKGGALDDFGCALDDFGGSLDDYYYE